jgi:hypothetical protein
VDRSKRGAERAVANKPISQEGPRKSVTPLKHAKDTHLTPSKTGINPGAAGPEIKPAPQRTSAPTKERKLSPSQRAGKTGFDTSKLFPGKEDPMMKRAFDKISNYTSRAILASEFGSDLD